jgi:hypothetical protein
MDAVEGTVRHFQIILVRSISVHAAMFMTVVTQTATVIKAPAMKPCPNALRALV